MSTVIGCHGSRMIRKLLIASRDWELSFGRRERGAGTALFIFRYAYMRPLCIKSHPPRDRIYAYGQELKKKNKGVLWLWCHVNRGKTAQNRTKKIAVITVIAPTTTVFFSFPSSLSDMRYAYLHCARLDQYQYALQIIPGVHF